MSEHELSASTDVLGLVATGYPSPSEITSGRAEIVSRSRLSAELEDKE